MTTKKFKNPPLAEVVCEFRFKMADGFDSTIPGMLYDKVKNDFPLKKQRNLNPVLNLNFEAGIISPLSQFYSTDESMLIQVGFDMLSINCVKNYPTWEVFEPKILEVFNEYIEVVKPASITRIGLRSINKINIEEKDIELKNYFNFYPQYIAGGEINSFQIRTESPRQNGRDVLIMNNVSIVSDKPEHSSFMLDIDYVMVQPEKVTFETVKDWLCNAHIELYNSFTNSCTEKLLSQFE